MMIPGYNQNTAEDVEQKQSERELRQQAQQTGEKTQEALDRAGEQLKQSARETGRQAEHAADERKNRLAFSIEDIGVAVDAAADRLYEKNHRHLADYGRWVSQGIRDASQALYTRSPEQLLHDTSNLARSNPGIVIGAMFTLGLAASRFFKASQTPAHE
ncbi:MAG: hypothetical protein ACLFSB_13290 [Chitinispirillaceae bacterium]